MRVYLHIPFCRSKCGYCDFCSGHPLELKDRYLAALRRERNLRLRPGPLDSVYWGGGTPSLLSPGELRPLMEGLCLAPGAEVTIEANPEDILPENLAGWSALGINRISVGVQSLRDDELAALGRRRSVREARTAMDALAGSWQNWSVDLIAGAAGQTCASLLATLDEVVGHGPPHLSLYALEVKPGSAVEALDGDAMADLLSEAWGFLEAEGYRHYEISNFCRPGRESRHNLGYWRRDPYCGLGASAHSFEDGVRSWNLDAPEAYVRALEAGEGAREGEERLDAAQARWEELLLQLRLDEGVERACVRPADWRPLLDAGLAAARGERVALTGRGMLVFNEVALYLEERVIQAK